MADAHQHLLDHGGDVSFWENGWLRTQLARWRDPDPQRAERRAMNFVDQYGPWAIVTGAEPSPVSASAYVEELPSVAVSAS